MGNENSTDNYHKRTGIPGLAIILLIAGAFIAGIFWSRMQGLEKQIADLKSRKTETVAGTKDQPSGTVNNPVVNQPTPGPREVDPITEADHIRGNRNADLVLFEWSDYQCPYCTRFHPTMEQVLKEYGDQVAWVYRHFPLAQLHQNAQKEAEASECAAELGGNDGFWKYLNTIFERTASNDGFPLENLVPLAKELGLDENKFKSCLDNGKYADKVQKDSNEGQAAGIQGTPGGFVMAKNGQSMVIEGAIPYEQLKGYVDQLLK